MGYGKLEPSDRGNVSAQSNESEIATSHSPPSATRGGKSKNKKLIFLAALSIVLIAASAVSAVLLIGVRTRASGPPGATMPRKPTQAISKACSKTRYPNLCVNSLLDFPGAMSASEEDLVHISFNMTLQHLSKALYTTSELTSLKMDSLTRSAYDVCLELLDDSVDAVERALTTVSGGGGGSDNQDVMTWLSAALTNQDTCSEGFEEGGSSVNGNVKTQVAEKLKDLSELVSNCLALFSGSISDDFSGVPVQNKRRLMAAEEDNISGDFPRWLSRNERRLLGLPVSAIQADIVVSKDGNGTVKTIAEAIKKAPEYSDRRTIIYVRAGR